MFRYAERHSRGWDEYTESGNDASSAERSMSLRQREKVQEMPRRRHCNRELSKEMRKLHGMLRRLGPRHDFRPRDEARRAVPLSRRGMLHDLRAAAAGAVPALRLRLARSRQPVSRFVSSRPPRRDDRGDALA